MKNRKLIRKKIHDKKCRKNQRPKKHKCKSVLKYHSIAKNESKVQSNRIQKDAPEIFSFTDNPLETICFFDDIITEIQRKSFGKVFFINSSQVTFVSVDVLIYLIAIMQNININMQMHYSFIGNLPREEKVAIVYHESGFMDYVSTRGKKLPSNNDKRRIVSGKRNDPILASEFCDFVKEKTGVDSIAIQPIQKILIELMSNVYHHAYKKDKDDIMKKKWYLYAEANNNSVKFIFVDTGVGIAKTVKKKFAEKVARLFSVNAIRDSELIKSTLLGEFRTETSEPYRGNGLPLVYGLAQQVLFKSFDIMSGSGKCSILKNGDINCDEFDRPICGTIFVFEVEGRI